MPAPDLIDERFDDIVSALRSSRPAAPEALRERVRAAVAESRPPARRSRRRFAGISWRRGALVLAPAMVAAAVGIAVVGGLVSAVSDDDTSKPGKHVAAAGSRGGPARSDQSNGFESYVPRRGPFAPLAAQGGGPRTAAADRAAGLPVSRARLQDYHASMRIRVRDVERLSGATTAAIRTTRRLGGYVVTVDYDTPGGRRGDAFLQVRVPIGRVQEAIARFSGLGTILAQDIRIRDVQGRVDELAKRIARLRRQLAEVNAELRAPGLGPDERRRLELRRDGLEGRLRALARGRSATIRQARLATLSLALTTRKPEQEAPAPPGRIERALDDAGGILVKEVAWTLYALIVAAPFVFLLLLAVAGARYTARRADQRLLEAP